MPKGKRGIKAGTGRKNTKAKRDSIEYALANANPNYNKGKEYQYNCQRCVVAYALLRRGEDVEALPEIKGDTTSHHWQEFFENQQWEPVKINKLARPLSDRQQETQTNIENEVKSWGDGSIGIVYVQWSKNQGAHVFNVENVNGKVRFVDAQDGTTDVSKYFKGIRANNKTTLLSRVDNLKPNPKYIDKVVKKK